MHEDHRLTRAGEVPLALAVAVLGYLVFWWRTHHQVIPRTRRDGEGAPPG